MKTLTLLMLTLALWCGAIPQRSVQAQTTVSFELFYDSLDPYGEWMEVGDYGYCWRPYAASDDPMWRPYSDGNWSYTDGGWTWVSNEDFGWATYHYGRWTRVVGVGWVWVPGYEWGPAWVSWRDTPDKEYVGWAPLPPEARFEISIGFNTWVDDYYDIGPSCYNFVRYRDIGEPRLRTVILPYERNVTIINHSVNITNISYRDSVVNNVFIGGPQYSFVRERSTREIRELKLRRRDDFDFDSYRRDPKGFGRGINRREGDDFFVAAPTIRRFRDDERRGPAKVKERVADVRFDRGWEGVKDRATMDQIRDRMRQDADRNRPQNLPSKTGVFGTREREGRVSAADNDQNTRDRDRDRKDLPPGRDMVPGRDDRKPMPGAGGASQADIARRLEEEKKVRENRGGTAMDDREKDGRPGRAGGAPLDVTGREKERRDAIEAEQRRREPTAPGGGRAGGDEQMKREQDRKAIIEAQREKEAGRKPGEEMQRGKEREAAETQRGETGRKPGEEMQRGKEREAAETQRGETGRKPGEEMQHGKEREAVETQRRDMERKQGEDMKRRQDAERSQNERNAGEEGKARMENERRKAMESGQREQGENQERARNMEREKAQRAAAENQNRQRESAENAMKQRAAAENMQRKNAEEGQRRAAENSQREAAERSRRSAEEGRRQQLQSQPRRAEEPRPQAKPQPQPQVQRREEAPPGANAPREGGKGGGERKGRPDKDDDKDKEKGKR